MSNRITEEPRKTVTIPARYHSILLEKKRTNGIPIEKSMDEIFEAGLRVKRLHPDNKSTDS